MNADPLDSRARDLHMIASFEAGLVIGPTGVRRATPQEEELNVLHRGDRRLEEKLDKLGRLALREISGKDALEFTAARRECLNLQDHQVRAWMDYYERFPAGLPEPE